MTKAEQMALRQRAVAEERKQRAIAALSTAHRQARDGFYELARRTAESAAADLNDVLKANRALRVGGRGR